MFSFPSNILFLTLWRTLKLTQIKGVPAAEAKLRAYGHPPTAGSEASSTERKSHPNMPPSVPAQDRKSEHGPVTVKPAWGKKSRASAFPSLAHLRVGKPWAWPLLESTEPHPRPETADGTLHTVMLQILLHVTPEGTFKGFPTLVAPWDQLTTEQTKALQQLKQRPMAEWGQGWGTKDDTGLKNSTPDPSQPWAWDFPWIKSPERLSYHQPLPPVRLRPLLAGFQLHNVYVVITLYCLPTASLPFGLWKWISNPMSVFTDSDHIGPACGSPLH